MDKFSIRTVGTTAVSLDGFRDDQNNANTRIETMNLNVFRICHRQRIPHVKLRAPDKSYVGITHHSSVLLMPTLLLAGALRKGCTTSLGARKFWSSPFPAFVFHPLSTFHSFIHIRVVPSVSKVLIAPIFSNQLNFETEGDTSDMHRIKSLDPEKICQFGRSFFVVSLSVTKLQRFEIVGAINTFETACNGTTVSIRLT